MEFLRKGLQAATIYTPFRGRRTEKATVFYSVVNNLIWKNNYCRSMVHNSMTSIAKFLHVISLCRTEMIFISKWG